MVGVLIAAIDTTIVVLALPEIQRSLDIGLASVIWVNDVPLLAEERDRRQQETSAIRLALREPPDGT